MVTRSLIITATSTVAVAVATAAALAATGGTFSSAAPDKAPQAAPAARHAEAPAAPPHDGAAAPKNDTSKGSTGESAAGDRGGDTSRGNEEGGGGGDRGRDGGDRGEGGGGEGGGGDRGEGGYDRDRGGDEGGGHGRGRGRDHDEVGRIHFNERTYPAYPGGCVTAASGLGATSFNIFNDSRMTVEVFSGATCDNGGPVAVVGPHGDTAGVFPQRVQGGVSVFNGVGASFRVLGHDDWDY
ncbi:hypothetical protein [Streptomyces sp. NPDC056061]|uniref:hypothetical protein n=1 Tax=Streptomyces sp. NPDC056061 TaxID=3345700 RepID=UPI0035DF3542